MLYFERPAARPGFAVEAATLLKELRGCVAGRAPELADFKRRDIWRRHKPALVGHDRGSAKCAYCERILEVGRELNVEHYRPKVKVTRWEGNPSCVANKPPSEVPIGPGYWWLGFDWSNYCLACSPCNQGWKRNLFPVKDRLECREGCELHERPLLLDPCKPFRTRDHFQWLPDAIMVGISDEGRATIITCGLNRKELVAARLKVAGDVERCLRDFISALRRESSEVDRTYRSLRELGAPDAEFAGMARWLIEQALDRPWELL